MSRLNALHVGAVIVCVALLSFVHASEKNMNGPPNVKQPPNEFVEFVDDEETKKFFDWTEKFGIKHKVRLAMLKTASGEILRGAVAAEDLEDGDVIVEAPEEAIVTPALAKRHPVLKEIFADQQVSWRDEMVLVLWLIYESNNPNSEYATYLTQFNASPTEYMSPMWDLDRIEAGPPLLRTETFSKLHRIAAQHAHLFPYLFVRYPKVFPPEKRHLFAYQPYKAMSQLAASRWWYLPVHGSHTSLFVPMADMVNFGNAYSTCAFDDASNSFKMTARQPFKKGEEILFWYTNDCEDLIQLHYGFKHADVAQCAGSSVEDNGQGDL